ncbi:hypothetical protein ACOSQ3_031826 [Xanthoceras sorbifolium]
MSCTLRGAVSVSGSGFNETKGIVVGSSQFRKSKSNNLPVLRLDVKGQPLVVSDHKDLRDWRAVKAPNKFFIDLPLIPLECVGASAVHRRRRWSSSALSWSRSLYLPIVFFFLLRLGY